MQATNLSPKLNPNGYSPKLNPNGYSPKLNPNGYGLDYNRCSNRRNLLAVVS